MYSLEKKIDIKPVKRTLPALDVDDRANKGFLSMKISPKTDSTTYLEGTLGISSTFLEGVVSLNFLKQSIRSRALFIELNVWVGDIEDERSPYEDLQITKTPHTILYTIRQVLWASSKDTGEFLPNVNSWQFQLPLPAQTPRPPNHILPDDNEPLPAFIPIPSSECHARNVHFQLRALWDPASKYVRAWQTKVFISVLNFSERGGQNYKPHCSIVITDQVPEFDNKKPDVSETRSSRKIIGKVFSTVHRRSSSLNFAKSLSKYEISVAYLSTHFGLGDDVDSTVFCQLPSGFVVDNIETALAQRILNQVTDGKANKHLSIEEVNKRKPRSRSVLASPRVESANPFETNGESYQTTPIRTSFDGNLKKTTTPLPPDIPVKLNEKFQICYFTEYDHVISKNFDISFSNNTKNQKTSFSMTYHIPASCLNSSTSTHSEALSYLSKQHIFSSCQCLSNPLHVKHAFVTVISIRAPSVIAAEGFAEILYKNAKLQQSSNQYIELSVMRKIIVVKFIIGVTIYPFNRVTVGFVTHALNSSSLSPVENCNMRKSTNMSQNSDSSDPNNGKKPRPSFSSPGVSQFFRPTSDAESFVRSLQLAGSL
ncbi:hypothetical protein HK096_005677 [Nowakowskiella sp. JEL0078]|nr:hypothetical protein HK096_005677 [Nowakowskiella sp. JEL0078]